jgi:ABC-type uncharacterized transport system substrate-binding protein
MDKKSLNRPSTSCSDNRKSAIQNRKLVGSVALVLTLAMCGAVATAQQPAKIPRIGYVSGTGDPKTPGLQVETFRQGLRDLGYVEGKNIVIEYRYTEGNQDRAPRLVAELIQLNVDVLVATTSPAIRAAKQATKTIPIVMVTTSDPIAAGLIDSLARPGGNITGLTSLTRELSGKRLELLKEMIPRVARVGVLWTTTGVPGLATAFDDYDSAARDLKISLKSLEVHGPNPKLEELLRDAVKARVSAIIAIRVPLLISHRKQIADFALNNRLALMSEGSEYVEVGSLVSYSASDVENYRRAAVYVDKIIKGAKPADLPVEQPKKFEFIINLKTAKQIGLIIPPNVLARADRIIR